MPALWVSPRPRPQRGHQHLVPGPGSGPRCYGGVEASAFRQGYFTKQQPTTLGEVDGRTTPRLEQIATAFKSAGFPIAVSANIDAALKTHAVFITALESAICMAGGSNTELARRRELLVLMVNAIRGGFHVLSMSSIPITPFNLHLMFSWMPRWFPIWYWQRVLPGKLGEVSLAAHANAAPLEIKQLIDEIRVLVGATSFPTPAMDQLYGSMDEIAS